MSQSPETNDFPIMKADVNTGLSKTVVDNLLSFGLKNADVEAIKSLTADLEDPLEYAGEISDYIGGSPFVDIVRLTEILTLHKKNQGNQSFKDYATSVIDKLMPTRSSISKTIAQFGDNSNKSDMYIRTLKNLLFACSFLVMTREQKKDLRKWVADCEDFMRRNPEMNVNGVFSWPEKAVTPPFGTSESATRNFIGYLDSSRFKANATFMKAMFENQKPAPQRNNPNVSVESIGQSDDLSSI